MTFMESKHLTLEKTFFFPKQKLFSLVSSNTDHQQPLTYCEGTVLDEACSGDTAHELRNSHIGVSLEKRRRERQ